MRFHTHVVNLASETFPAAGCTNGSKTVREGGPGDGVSAIAYARNRVPIYMVLQGTLVKYGPGNAHTAFVSGIPPALISVDLPASCAKVDRNVPAGDGNKHVVLVGGLGDGLLLAP